DDVVHGRVVGELDAATEGVGQHATGQVPEVDVPFGLQKDLLELAGTAECFAGGQLARRVDRDSGNLAATASNRVEGLKAEAQGVELRVARSTVGLAPVFFEALAEGQSVLGCVVGWKDGDIRRRRGRGLSEEL